MRQNIGEKASLVADAHFLCFIQALLIESLVSISQRKFSPQNATFLAKLKRLGELYVQPNGEGARQPSHYLKLVSNEVARASKASIFRSPLSWLSSSELSLRLLEYLATVYPDLYRCVVHNFSSNPYNTVPFATLAYMLSKTVLDIFAPLPASAPVQPPPSPSLSSVSSPSLASNSSFLSSAGSTLSNSTIGGFGPSFSASANAHSSFAPSAHHARDHPSASHSAGIHSLSLSLLPYMPTLSADKGSISVHCLEGKLPDLSLLLFDSPHAFEEVFCWAMYIFYFLIVEKVQVLQMTRVTSILSKVSQRLRKLLSKSSKLPDFIAYAMKAVKPNPLSDEGGPLTAGNAAQKIALLNRIISAPYDEDAHEAIVSLTILLDEEDRLGLGLGNSIESYTPTSQASAGNLDRNASDPSPSRSKISRKHTDSPSKRKKSAEVSEQKYGFAFLRAHLASLIGALYNANKYENRTFGVPHLRGSRLFVNSLIRLLWSYTAKVARGALDLDTAIKSLHKGGLTRSPFEPLVEYLTLENSTVARCSLDIILKCITAFGEHQSYQNELNSSLGELETNFTASSIPPSPIITSVETHISPPTKHKKHSDKAEDAKKEVVSKKESGEQRKDSDSSSGSPSQKSHSHKDSGGSSKDADSGRKDTSPSRSLKRENSAPKSPKSPKSPKKEGSSPSNKKSSSPTRHKEPSPRRHEETITHSSEDSLDTIVEVASPHRGRTLSPHRSSDTSLPKTSSTSSDELGEAGTSAGEPSAAAVAAAPILILPQKPKIADRAGRRSPERRRVVEPDIAKYRSEMSGSSPSQLNHPPQQIHHSSSYRETSSSRESAGGSVGGPSSPPRTTVLRKKSSRNHSSKDSASSPPATALRSGSMTRSDSSSSVSSTSSTRSRASSRASSFSSIQNYWSQYTATSISQFEKLLECDIVGAAHPHFAVITRNVLPLAITLQSFVMSRVEEFTNAFLVLDPNDPSVNRRPGDSTDQLTRSDSSVRSDTCESSTGGNGIARTQTTRSLFRILNTFWNKFMGEGCIALTSIVSKQWLLLGFEDEDPTKVIRNQWPIRVVRFLSEHISPPERFDDLVLPRLMRKSEDYDIAIVFIELCQLVVTVTKDAIGETKNSFLPPLISHSYALEYLCTEILFVFDTLWTSQKLSHNDPLNVQRVMKHLRRHLLLALLNEPTVERVIIALKVSVSAFDITAIDDPSYGIKSRKNPLKFDNHFSFIDAIEDSYEQFIHERNMEIARIEAEKRRALRRRSSTGGKKSRRSTSSSNTTATTSTETAAVASSKPHSKHRSASTQRRHRKAPTSGSVTDLPLHDSSVDSARLVHI